MTPMSFRRTAVPSSTVWSVAALGAVGVVLWIACSTGGLKLGEATPGPDPTVLSAGSTSTTPPTPAVGHPSEIGLPGDPECGTTRVGTAATTVAPTVSTPGCCPPNRGRHDKLVIVTPGGRILQVDRSLACRDGETTTVTEPASSRTTP